MGDIWGFLRDALVLAYLFGLRIGVPILITLMLGAWLQRALQKPETEEGEIPTGATQRCWERGGSAESNRVRNAVAQRPDLPCWLALQVTGTGLRHACYGCPVYTSRNQGPAPVLLP